MSLQAAGGTLGRPVVPDVYTRVARLLGCGATTSKSPELPLPRATTCALQLVTHQSPGPACRMLSKTSQHVTCAALGSVQGRGVHYYHHSSPTE